MMLLFRSMIQLQRQIKNSEISFSRKLGRLRHIPSYQYQSINQNYNFQTNLNKMILHLSKEKVKWRKVSVGIVCAFV